MNETRNMLHNILLCDKAITELQEKFEMLKNFRDFICTHTPEECRRELASLEFKLFIFDNDEIATVRCEALGGLVESLKVDIHYCDDCDDDGDCIKDDDCDHVVCIDDDDD